jgi:2,3-bisphosphoglycerate-independent phosphoglycerate mutase
LVDSYDQKAEMHAAKVAEKAAAAIARGDHDFIVVNFANADLVAQTGDIEATIAALEAVDAALAIVVEAVRAAKGTLLLTADHGNCEAMLDSRGQPTGAHSANAVPFLYVCEREEEKHMRLRDGGDLTDVAPTVLDALGLPRPAEMTGSSLRQVG